jgi:hypothetical protein
MARRGLAMAGCSTSRPRRLDRSPPVRGLEDQNGPETEQEVLGPGTATRHSALWPGPAPSLREAFPRSLDVSIDLQDVAVRITEEQRAMAPWLVSRSRENGDATFLECACACCNLARRDPERGCKESTPTGGDGSQKTTPLSVSARILEPTRYSNHVDPSCRCSGNPSTVS